MVVGVVYVEDERSVFRTYQMFMDMLQDDGVIDVSYGALTYHDALELLDRFYSTGQEDRYLWIIDGNLKDKNEYTEDEKMSGLFTETTGHQRFSAGLLLAEKVIEKTGNKKDVLILSADTEIVKEAVHRNMRAATKPFDPEWLTRSVKEYAGVDYKPSID